MLQTFVSPLALISLLAGLAATAAQGAAAKRSIVLTGKAGEAHVLSLALGTVTFLLLDAPIVRESVEVEDRARFARVDVSEQGLTLQLRAPLKPGEQLALRFTYREGSPRSAVFLLTGQPGQVDEVVNVSRPPQTTEACHAELRAIQERCEAQARELAELKVQPSTLSPADVALSGFVGFEGLQGERLWQEGVEISGELLATRCWGLGGATWTVVVLEVSNAGTAPWVPAWAEVTPLEGGEPRRARVVLSRQAVLSPGDTVSVAIEVELPTRERKTWLKAPHSLRVCDASGSRCLSASRVTL
ncbi:MAG TPA: DUF2381 family protein [Myxococcaceae bacterium]|jgi:uncharacterized protein (TIGR02268 family)